MIHVQNHSNIDRTQTVLFTQGVLYILFKPLGKNLKECLLSTG